MCKSLLWAAILLLVAACSPDETARETTTVPAATSAVEVISQLHDDLVSGDFEGAGALTMPDHAALASLAEGASETQVAEALENDDKQVATNFWSGFAQGAGEAFLGEVELEDLGMANQGGTEFGLVGVKPIGMVQRPVATQDVEGPHIDLFASFGDGLADRMIPPVDALLESGSPDATMILASLQTVVDSLLLAAEDPSITPDASQSILQLVEMITRVS